MKSAITTALCLLFAGVTTLAFGGTILQHQQRTCFPAKLWSTGTVSSRYRPCARVIRVYEDGSTDVAVSDADGTVRYTYTVGALDR